MSTDEDSGRCDPVAAKEVNVWTWRRMLRDHCPLRPSQLFTMHTIATYMDRHGFTFVGQTLIAEGARTSVRSVQRHIEAARRLGWLYVELTRVVSRQSQHMSFHNRYWACVPEDLELPDVDEELRRVVANQTGDVDEGDDMVMSSRHPPTQGDDTTMSPPMRPTVEGEGDDTGSTTCRHPEAEGDDRSDEGDDTAMSQELSNRTLHRTLQEGALARAPAVDKSTKAKNEEPAHVSTVLPARALANEEVLQEKTGEPPSAPQPSTEPPAPTIAERIAKALTLCPTLSDHGVAKMVQGATPEGVAAVRCKLVA